MAKCSEDVVLQGLVSLGMDPTKGQGVVTQVGIIADDVAANAINIVAHLGVITRWHRAVKLTESSITYTGRNIALLSRWLISHLHVSILKVPAKTKNARNFNTIMIIS